MSRRTRRCPPPWSRGRSRSSCSGPSPAGRPHTCPSLSSVLTPFPPLRSGEGGLMTFPLSRRERGSGGEDPPSISPPLARRVCRTQNKKETTMRFMVLVKANEDSEAGVLPDKKILTEMGKFNIELEKAGVMLAGEGLQASSKGARVRFSGSKRTVIDGPFAETKELIAGFWLWEVKSLSEAIEWLKRAPFQEGEVEIRQVFEPDDFGDALKPEFKEQEKRLRAKTGKKKD